MKSLKIAFLLGINLISFCSSSQPRFNMKAGTQFSQYHGVYKSTFYYPGYFLGVGITQTIAKGWFLQYEADLVRGLAKSNRKVYFKNDVVYLDETLTVYSISLNQQLLVKRSLNRKSNILIGGEFAYLLDIQNGYKGYRDGFNMKSSSVRLYQFNRNLYSFLIGYEYHLNPKIDVGGVYKMGLNNSIDLNKSDPTFSGDLPIGQLGRLNSSSLYLSFHF